ncbi:MAG: hypothetical protein KatS3mg096_843 [Candidatus Parcubacteria bacterium]|nr:MAG: hypothetical protein KatS3mg096_843 [Candidatus Parcubacteria bacterium]
MEITTWIYLTFFGWAIFSAYYIRKLWKSKDTKDINFYLYDLIPSVFTTLGILGTFIGIYIGLQKFDVNDITNSIPSLLNGLKTSFFTSILGIFLSIIFNKISKHVLYLVEKNAPSKPTDELAALQEITSLLKEFKDQSNKNFQLLNHSIIGDADNTLSTQLIKIKNKFIDIETKFDEQYDILKKMQQSLGGDTDTSLLTQMQKIRAEQNDSFKEIIQKIVLIVNTMNRNNELIAAKFQEFSQLLAKNNTELLVEVMKHATEEFNKHMSAIVEKLVQENFEELNKSVQRMNQWQQENKDMIEKLTEQFRKVSNDFAIASQSIKEITANTSKLTDENSHLSRLVKELQKVMIDDTKFQDIVTKLTLTIETLKENTESFDETTNKLNEWVKKQMNFTDSVAKLLARLEEIEKIKDINEIFWANTKKQLNEGVAIIEKANQKLADDLENINTEFYERLNVTLQNLDELIQRIIMNYDRNFKK